MTIAFTKYINITSAVGGTSEVIARELIGRLFTTSDLVPTGSVLEFSDAASVGAYFGLTSEEYLRAVPYFSFISKNITSPQKISYARWVDADTPPMIFGKKLVSTLADFQAISNGSFTMTLGTDVNVLTGMDFTTVLSFADVALAIQAEVNSQVGIQWSGATVVFDAVRGGFDFVGGDAVAAVVDVAISGVGTDIVGLIGWTENEPNGAIFSNGALTQSITDVLTTSTNMTNNFGSFLFMPSLSNNQIVEAATWNDGQNILFQYYVPTTVANSAVLEALVNNYAGIGLIISETIGEYPEQLPMEILAATDYTAANSVQNFMFYQANLTPSVTTTLESDALDAIRVNYYGSTQQAGKIINFFQRGVLMGMPDDPRDMNTYANEQWLKDAAGVQLMQLFLVLPKISANTQGRATLMNALQSVIAQALLNGTISVGKPLNTTQILFITQVSNDPNAWYQVQNSGYWLDCAIVLVGIEYIATYTLIYTQDNAIRKVEGTHILI